MKKMLLMMLAVMLLAACASKKKDKVKDEEPKPLFGKYMYLMDDSVLHTTKDCLNVTLGKIGDGERVIGMKF